jgi:solute carrier family 44 (choline transporter-like protein), member 2/4/5
MRWLAKPIVWLGIVLFIVFLIGASAFSFNEFNQLRQQKANESLIEFKFVADTNYYRSLPLTWLILGIVSLVLLVVSILVLVALCKRLRLALAILKEASKAVGYNIFSLFWPFIPFVLEISVFVYWGVVAVHLATSGKPIYRIAFNETMTNTSNVTLGELCDPKKWTGNPNMPGQCVFWQYGYDPQIDLDGILDGERFIHCCL